VKKNKRLIKPLLWLFLVVCQTAMAIPVFYANDKQPPPLEIANLLGWVPTTTNLCKGFYQEPAIILACPNPLDLNEAVTTITADQTVFSARGTSILTGHVTVTQPGRKMTADQALLYRDPISNQIAQIELQGNVHFMEAGKHLVAQNVFVDLQKKYARLDNALYRLVRPSRFEVLNAWGTASCAERISSEQLNLFNATYTTCSPLNVTWHVAANRIHIDKEKGRGEAVNTYLYIHEVPVVWVPYFSFPVDKRRKSGFLFPTFAYSNNNGLRLSFPYYLNLAPNYDATITPTYYSRRGVEFGTAFRYISAQSVGDLKLELIPYDSAFANFRHDAPAIFGVTPATRPFLDELAHDSNTRGLLSFRDYTNFNIHSWGSLDINYVTDDYFLQDFAYSPFNSSQDQLLNEAQINYASDNWRFFGRLQSYQTLHPINQQPVLDQYSRLPQLYITSDYPDYPNQLDFQINSEFISFDHPKDFLTHIPIVTGQRFHIQPSVSFPIIYPAFFFTPKLQLDGTFYKLQDIKPWQTDSPSRALPIFDIDTGIYLQRQIGSYLQTLEPRLFYLYVPEKNQNDIAIFDTTLPAFSFPQLFRTNRFIGYDRLGDANQVALAVTTRFLNPSGFEKFRASIGQIYYFHKPQVCLTPDCFNQFQVGDKVSPLAGEMSYNFTPCWNAIANAAVDIEEFGLNNATIQFRYHPNPKHIFSAGYDFVRKGDRLTTEAINSSKNDLNRINFGIAWQLNDHWQALGSWNYNISHSHPEAYFYGVQYDSCCWAIRAIASRIIIAESDVHGDNTTYQTNYYVQLQLKGLGNIGNNDPGSLLTNSILGYQDTFSKG
jgi:LPS-assembly protein